MHELSFSFERTYEEVKVAIYREASTGEGLISCLVFTYYSKWSFVDITFIVVNQYIY